MGLRYTRIDALKVVKKMEEDYSLKVKDLARIFNTYESHIVQLLRNYYGKSYKQIRDEQFKKICHKHTVKELMKMFNYSKFTVISKRKQFNCQKKGKTINLNKRQFLARLRDCNYSVLNMCKTFDMSYKASMNYIKKNPDIYEEWKKHNKTANKIYGDKTYFEAIKKFVETEPSTETKVKFAKKVAELYGKKYRNVLTYINKLIRNKK